MLSLERGRPNRKGRGYAGCPAVGRSALCATRAASPSRTRLSPALERLILVRKSSAATMSRSRNGYLVGGDQPRASPRGRREAAAARARLARPACRRRRRRLDDDADPRHLERQGEAGAPLAAALPELARRLPHRAREHPAARANHPARPLGGLTAGRRPRAIAARGARRDQGRDLTADLRRTGLSRRSATGQGSRSSGARQSVICSRAASRCWRRTATAAWSS